MTPKTWLLAALVVLTAVSSPALGIDSTSATPTATDAAVRPDIDVDDVVMDVSVHENGTADWRVEYRVRLDDENVTKAFEELEADVEENSSAYRERFAARMRDTVSGAENATGREMTARNFGVHTERHQLPQEYGVIVYTFQWVGFAETTGDRIKVGDALSGLFLDGETTLLIAWPSGYSPTTVTPEPTETRERAVVWTGPLDFAGGGPNVVLDAVERTSTDESTATADATTTETGPAGEQSSGSGPSTAHLLGGLLVALAVGSAAFVARRRGNTDAEAPSGGNESDAGDALKSNEERVLDLLADYDGRIKQQAVVEELGWTEAKTSRVVSALKDDGRVEVFRLGRENVVSLPDEDDT